jgi:uncharacterized protein GlcG (DUF336 family)
MVCISLDEAAQIVDAALEKGHELGLAPLTVVVLDPGGYPVAIKREDGSGLLRCDVATAKAWGPLAMGWSGKELVERANRAPQFFSALTTLSGGRMLPVPGGVPIHNSASELVGSVGISGDTADNDEACAVHGIQSAGLVAALD